MKTCTATIHANRKLQPGATRQLQALMAASVRQFAGLAIAVLAAAVVITLSIWLASKGVNPVVGAGAWALGFFFLALAVDSQGPAALLRAASGLALPVLALLQDRVSADFLIVAGVLLAAWTALVLVRKLSGQEA